MLQRSINEALSVCCECCAQAKCVTGEKIGCGCDCHNQIAQLNRIESLGCLGAFKADRCNVYLYASRVTTLYFLGCKTMQLNFSNNDQERNGEHLPVVDSWNPNACTKFVGIF